MSLTFPAIDLQPKADQKFGNRLKKMQELYSDSYIHSISHIIDEIRTLKKQRNAVILSHYYMSPLLQVLDNDGGVADYIGDSLGLSIEASRSKADYIIFCGVRFMAETAHILNPSKTVLIPEMKAGCSLASSISSEDVRQLKQKYPGVPVISYINTYAETKAETDICCTSRNAVKIVDSFDADRIIFIPDKYMGQNLKNTVLAGSKKEIILWEGSCEVHEQFAANISQLVEEYPSAKVLLHWEVPEDTVGKTLTDKNGILGSTAEIINYVGNSDNKQFILGSECDLGATLKGMYPDKQFITPCITCPHMKQINIYNTLETLRAIGTEREEKYKITLDEDLLERAYLPVKRMIDLS